MCVAKNGSSDSLLAETSIQGIKSCGDLVNNGCEEKSLNRVLVKVAKHKALSQVVPDFGWVQMKISVGWGVKCSCSDIMLSSVVVRNQKP